LVISLAAENGAREGWATGMLGSNAAIAAVNMCCPDELCYHCPRDLWLVVAALQSLVVFLVPGVVLLLVYIQVMPLSQMHLK
jgi:hypothetical protein